MIAGKSHNLLQPLKDSVPQERIDLTYQPGGTLVTKSTGTTTYTTAVIDDNQCGYRDRGLLDLRKRPQSYYLQPRLELTDVTSIDGQKYTTQYTYDNPTNPWEQGRRDCCK